MLRLSSRSARRIGTSYICTSCLVACHSTRSQALRPTLIPSHHGRHLSTTSRLLTPTTETSTTTSTDGAGDVKIPPPEAPKKRKRKKPKNEEKTIAAQAEGERQLQVLQGALQALKNVLAAQNISVDQIGKLGTQVDQNGLLLGGATEKKEEQTEQSSEKKEARKKSKRKASDDQGATAADAAPVDGAPAKPKKAAGKKATKREKVKQKAAPKKARPAFSKVPQKDRPKKKTPPPSLGSGVVWGDYKMIGENASEGPEEGGKTKSKTVPLEISSIRARDLFPTPVLTDHPTVPGLSYGLERVLFNPGVYHLQDPRSRVYNFDPYLSEIMPIQEFDFNALKQYVTSSKDNTLIGIAKEHGKKYTGSTSSMTSMLSHFHYLLSAWREINTEMLSKGFVTESLQFTKIMKGPAAVFLHWKDGTYAIDADKEFDSANILSMLGKSMEKLLTVSKEEYERYRHINSDQITEEERNAAEAFHYTKFLDFMMRSQLDAHDPRVPGSGMFDLKTRAVVSIRMDAKGFHKGLGYEIRNRFGQWESFEREYYDMIRSAFLKYSLQVRMGRMDGIFVAFHNTQRIFGFQYIPLSEMDLALHGTSNTTLGDREYRLSLALLNDILDRATKKFPEQSLRLHFETRTSANAPFMYIFAKPVSQQDIDEVQNANRASIEQFEREILGLAKQEAEVEAEAEAEIEAEAEAEAEAQAEAEAADKNEEVVKKEVEVVEAVENYTSEETSSLAAWNEVRQMVEDAVDDDEVGVGAVREAIEDALEQSGLLHAKSSTEARGYVDALLSAITNSASKPEPTLDAPVEEEVAADEDDSAVTQEIPEPESEPTTEQSASEVEVDSEQSQIEEKPGNTSGEDESEDSPIEEIKENSDESLEAQPESEQTTSPTSNDEPKDVMLELNDSASLEEATSQTQTDVNATREVEEEGEEEEDQEEEEEEADDIDDELEEGESKRDLNTASSMSPLKDLIVRMAQRIDEKAPSDEAEGSIDDSSKLKEFERILGELIARSKDEGAEPRTDNTGSTSGAPTESGVEGEVEILETEAQKAEGTEGASQTEATSEEVSGDAKPAEEEIDENLLGMVLTIRNKVNGEYVMRPGEMKKGDDWVVEYNIEEIAPKRANTIYRQIQARRRAVFEDTGNKESEWYKMFRGRLEQHTLSGRKFRAAENLRAQNHPVHIMGFDKSLPWEEVFGRPKDPQPTGIELEQLLEEQEEEHLETRVESNLQDQVKDQVPYQVESQVENQAEAQAEDQVEGQAENEVKDEGESQVEGEAKDEAKEEVADQTEDQVESQEKDEIKDEVKNEAEGQVEDEVKDKEQDERENEK
ncbi:Pet127-domain-containing protein [Daldinia caldariorum]|uniref:Pet127-domain-containing protein n=1 Tax=Daldinia caldariorum TaxID=326644 RepID=UPI002007488F|nr:Pet127-domain-containing protein [Daldinia caldariorum]KAI1468534.1 Pet127-domain-containing protein [Daldinia caldariorum]